MFATRILVGVLLAALTFQDPPTRLPEPSKEEQAAKLKLVREVFKEEYARRAPLERQTLAKKLLQQAIETKDDPAIRYVLLNESQDVATKSGDLDTALRAIDEMAKSHFINSLAMKSAAIGTAAPLARTPEEFKVLALAYLKVSEEAVRADEFDLAGKSAAQAVPAAKKVKDINLVARSEAQTKAVAVLSESFQKLKKAREVLAASPDNPAANQAVGEYECLIKGEWELGLPKLAKSADPALKAIAARDLSKPTEAAPQAALGDGWWERAENESGPARGNLRRRAAWWYSQALPQLAGLNRVKVEKRLAEADPRASPVLTRSILFSSPEQLKLFQFAGGTWRIKDGELLATCEGGSQWATLKTPYSSLSQVALSARIVPPSRKELRLWIGPIHVIFNWENADQNHFRNGIILTSTSPSVLTPGKEQEIVLRQEGKNVILTVDGVKVYETEAVLAGTVSFQAACGSTVGVRQLRIDGTIDRSREAVAETREHP